MDTFHTIKIRKSKGLGRFLSDFQVVDIEKASLKPFNTVRTSIIFRGSISACYHFVEVKLKNYFL